MAWDSFCYVGGNKKINEVKMKNKAKQLIKILISLLLMCLLLRNINPYEIKNVVTTLEFETAFIAILIYLISIIINAIKWKVLLPNTSLSFLTFLSFRSQLYSTVLPGQLFGEASKLTLWRHKNEDFMRVTASVVFDKITGMMGQIILAIIGFYFSSVGKSIETVKYFWALGVVFLLIILISGEKHIAGIINQLIDFIRNKHNTLGLKLEELYSAWRTFSVNKTVLLKSIVWGMANQFMGIVMVWYVSSNLNLNVNVIDFCWIMPMLSFVLLLPISYAGIGLRDASLTSMLSIYGVSAGTSLIISSMLLLGQVVASAMGGVMALIFNTKNNKDVK